MKKSAKNKTTVEIKCHKIYDNDRFVAACNKLDETATEKKGNEGKEKR